MEGSVLLVEWLVQHYFYVNAFTAYHPISRECNYLIAQRSGGIAAWVIFRGPLMIHTEQCRHVARSSPARVPCHFIRVGSNRCLLSCYCATRIYDYIGRVFIPIAIM